MRLLVALWALAPIWADPAEEPFSLSEPFVAFPFGPFWASSTLPRMLPSPASSARGPRTPEQGGKCPS